MILEVAEVHIKADTGEAFAEAVQQSIKDYISVTDGYISAELQRSIEDPTRFLLMIQWETLEAHTVNFRQSARFDKHRALISPFFAEAPFVQHFEVV